MQEDSDVMKNVVLDHLSSFREHDVKSIGLKVMYHCDQSTRVGQVAHKPLVTSYCRKRSIRITVMCGKGSYM